MKSLAILGASGHGKIIADIGENCGFSVTFFDDQQQGNLGPWKIKGTSEDLLESCKKFDGVIIGIGNNATRQDKLSVLVSAGATIPNLIHPSASVSQYANLGIGSVVCAGAIVNAFVSAGKGIIINTGATVDHDCYLGDFTHLSPGVHLAGGVRVGSRSWIGIGASVIQQVEIGQDTIIGAGSVVIRNIPDSVTAVGVPAAIIK